MKRFKHLAGVLIAGSCLALAASAAHAERITITLEGQVTQLWDPYGMLAGKINVSGGDVIRGYYTYESATPDSYPGYNVGMYWMNSAQNGISLEVNGFRFYTDPGLNSPNGFLMTTVNNPNLEGDLLQLVSHANHFDIAGPANAYRRILWTLRDMQNNSLGSEALPDTVPNLSNWQSNELRIESQLSGPPAQGFIIMGTVRAVRKVTVPIGNEGWPSMLQF